MEKKCKTCKYYHGGYCYNKQVGEAISTQRDASIRPIEEGYFDEYLKEQESKLYKLSNLVISELEERNYIKKNRKNIKDFAEVDIEEYYLLRAIEEISDLVLSFYANSSEDITQPMEVLNKEFGCVYWE